LRKTVVQVTRVFTIDDEVGRSYYHEYRGHSLKGLRIYRNSYPLNGSDRDTTIGNGRAQLQTGNGTIEVNHSTTGRHEQIRCSKHHNSGYNEYETAQRESSNGRSILI
jgi:hypothetical protein